MDVSKALRDFGELSFVGKKIGTTKETLKRDLRDHFIINLRFETHPKSLPRKKEPISCTQEDISAHIVETRISQGGTCLIKQLDSANQVIASGRTSVVERTTERRVLISFGF